MPPDGALPNGSLSSAVAEAAWREHRQRILDIGYRMMGTISDAEDIAQEVFIKLLAVDVDELDDVLGWLVTVTSRLCVDRLRRHENSRRSYVGPWLPEPVIAVGGDSVSDRITLDESVRMALLVVLDRLSPAERAAFVLHDIFSVPFAEIGEIVGRSPQACRQLATRARRRIEEDPTTTSRPVDHEQHRAIADRFAAACQVGDLDGLVALLAPNAVGDFDSGGLVLGAPLTELDGAEAIAAQLVASVSVLGADFTACEVNGDPGVVMTFGPQVAATIALGIRDGQIDLVHGVGNPAKLVHLQPWSAPGRG